jgi:phospholipid/cholesterol/gamma-HCH transport system substrate-binding protein
VNLRRRNQSVFGNPIMVGALTVLVAIVAVTLAFQANNGLPFVPRYVLHVQIRDAEELTHGAEVHMGGALVGTVSKVVPTRTASGQPIALLDLELNKDVEPLPVDSRFTVRLKAAIGLKYLDLTLGHSSRTWPDGATVPLHQSGAEVDLDQFFDMFNPPTRRGVAASTVGFSNALAGRGSDINEAIGAFLPLVTDLGPVMQNLAARDTDLAGFFRGLGAFTHALVPVAQQQADLYANLDTTFKALSGVAYPYIQEWISDSPPAFESVIQDGPHEQAFIKDTAALFSELRPGFATLPQSAPVLADAFAAGARNLPGSIALDRRTTDLAKTLQSYGQNPTVQAGLDRLTLTLHSLIAPLSFLTPAQSTCNYVTLFLRNIASTLSEQLGTGTALRFNLVVIDDVPGAESVASSVPYLTPDTSSNDEHGPLHVNPYPNTDAPGETPECAAGNEPYSGMAALVGNPPGNVGTHTEATSASGS